MTKLEELKAALEAATPGEWEPLMTCGELHVCTPVNEGCDVGTICVPYERPDATFIALAHNLMPQLLEAVEVLKAVVPLMDIAFNYDGDVFGRQHNNATDVYSAAECVLSGLK